MLIDLVEVVKLFRGKLRVPDVYFMVVVQGADVREIGGAFLDLRSRVNDPWR